MLVSLWLPWYSFTIPSAFIDQAEGAARQFGALAPLISQGAEIARHQRELRVSGWRVLNQIDIGLALVSGVVGSVSVLDHRPGQRSGRRGSASGRSLSPLLAGRYTSRVGARSLGAAAGKLGCAGAQLIAAVPTAR